MLQLQIRTLKFQSLYIHYLIRILYHTLAKFEPNRMVHSVKKDELYMTKKLFSGKQFIFKLPSDSASKIMVVQHQVKSSTKHDISDQYETLSK